MSIDAVGVQQTIIPGDKRNMEQICVQVRNTTAVLLQRAPKSTSSAWVVHSDRGHLVRVIAIASGRQERHLVRGETVFVQEFAMQPLRLSCF